MKVIGKTRLFLEEIIVDEYIPIIAQWEPCIRELDSPIPPRYYRTGDFKKSLIEIGVNDKGFLKGITTTLVNIKDITFIEKEEEINSQSTSYGLPLIDISHWPLSEDYWDVEGIFKVNIYLDSITILLNPKEEVNSILKTKKVRFFLNRINHIVGVSFFNFSKEEYLRCVNTLIESR